MIESLIGRPRDGVQADGFASAPVLEREFRLSPTSLKTAALKGRVASKALELVAQITVFKKDDVAKHFERREKPKPKRKSKR